MDKLGRAWVCDVATLNLAVLDQKVAIEPKGVL